jgi:hypothetical protein
MILGTTTLLFGHPSHLKFSLSSLDRRQAERVNQIIEDMLRDCALSDGPKCDQHLPLAGFSYNNSYQESINLSPFEALYG